MSRVVRPDPSRTIQLDGVGDVSRPVEVGRDATGLDHLSMRAYDFRAGQVIDGEAEGDEVVIVLLSGCVEIQIVGTDVDETYELAGRESPFEAPPHTVYLPPHHRYQLRMDRDATVSYSRVKAQGGRKPFHVPAADTPIHGLAGGIVRRDLMPEGASEHITCEEWILPAGAWHPMPGLRFEGTGDMHLDVLLHAVLRDRDEHLIAVTADANRPWLLRSRDTLAVPGAAFAFAVPPTSDAAILCFRAGTGPARATRVTENAVPPA